MNVYKSSLKSLNNCLWNKLYADMLTHALIGELVLSNYDFQKLSNMSERARWEFSSRANPTV